MSPPTSATSSSQPKRWLKTSRWERDRCQERAARTEAVLAAAKVLLVLPPYARGPASPRGFHTSIRSFHKMRSKN